MLKSELDYAMERGIINEDDVLNQINDMKKQEILEKHPYEIWQGNNGYWYTYLPGKVKRRLIKKATKEKIEQAILLYYQSQDNEKIVFCKLYLEWLTTYKCLKVSEATIDRIQCSYERFYQDSLLDKTSVKDIDILMIDTFIHKAIKENDLNRKQYNNMVIIIRQVLDYALMKQLILSNPLQQFKLSANFLRKDMKKKSETQVFTIDERKCLESLIQTDFINNPKSSVPLAILFDFQTGLRLGELVTLKWSDIDGDYIQIRRTEIHYREVLPDGTKGQYVIDIKESAKSDAGNREVYLTPKAKEILSMIKKFNFQNQLCSDFIFINEQGRLHERCIDNGIRKYCKKLNIIPKSMHKIRKTYISTLIDSGLNIDEIRRLVDHEDAQTTLNSYCFNRLDKSQTNKLIAEAL